MYRRKIAQWLKHMDFTILDLVSLFASMLLAFYIRKPIEAHIYESREYLSLLISLLVIDFISLSMTNGMKEILRRGYMIEMAYTIRNVGIVFCLETMFLFSMQLGDAYSRITFFYTMLFYLILSYNTRVIYKDIYKRTIIPKRGRSLLVITDIESLNDLNTYVNERYFDSFRLAGVCLTNQPEKGILTTTLPIVCTVDEVYDWVRLNWVDQVLLVLPPDEQMASLAHAFTDMGITVHMGINHLMNMLPGGKRQIEQIGGFDVVTVFWNSSNFVEAGIKRLFDIIGGFIGCIATLILTLFLAPAIYFSSKGPVFFTQERIGRNGKPFKVYKFRSMYTDAEERKKEYMAQNRVKDGMMFKLDFDPRIIGNVELPDGTRKTGLGEFIRKTSLDEFPQFFNVLKGDMSLVGTRPPTRDEWAKYQNHHRARMAMRPGITGMWQVSGRSNITDFEEIVRLDTKYIAQWTLALDVKILFKTVFVVIKGEGSM